MSTQRTTKAAKNIVSAKPSATVLANFLNNYYTNFASESEQKLKFKTLTKKQEDKIKEDAKSQKPKPSKAVIDLNDFEALRIFAKEAEKCQKQDPTHKLSKQTLRELTDNTYDGRLRGLLEIAAVASIKPPKPEGEKQKKDKDAEPKPRAKPQPKENRFEKFVIPGLHLGVMKTHSIDDHIKAINDFFTNKDKLRTRAYNLRFPHARHNPNQPAVGVNVIYLQHVCKYHDEVLKQIVDEVSEREILSFVQTQFVEGFKLDKVTDEELSNLRLQLQNSEIVSGLLNAKKQDLKWIDELKAIRAGPKGKGQTQTQNPLSKQEKAAVVALVRELNTVKTFIDLVLKAKEANEDRDLRECFEDYEALLSEIEGFYNEHRPRVKSHATFLRYLIESTLFITEKFGYKTTGLNKDKQEVWKSPLKSFVTDLHTKLSFKFDRQTRTAIDEVLSGKNELTDEVINAAAEKFKAAWNDVNSPKLYDINKLDIYAKFGKFVQASIGKQCKVAVGIAIVQFLFEQIRVQRALNGKKKELVIYIKA